MKNVQLFEEFVNNLSSNHVNEADAADVWPARPPFQTNVKGTDGKQSQQVITNPEYWVNLDMDIPSLVALGVLEADLPKEYVPFKDKKYNQMWMDWFTDKLVDYCDDKEDKIAEEFVYRLIYGTDAWQKKYHPQGVKAGAKGLLKDEKPEDVNKYAMPALKNLVLLKKEQSANKWIPLVDMFKAAYNKDESFETLGSALKKANPQFYKDIVDCYKYWMDNVNKAGIKNVSSMAGKPKKAASSNPKAAPSF